MILNEFNGVLPGFRGTIEVREVLHITNERRKVLTIQQRSSQCRLMFSVKEELLQISSFIRHSITILSALDIPVGRKQCR